MRLFLSCVLYNKPKCSDSLTRVLCRFSELLNLRSEKFPIYSRLAKVQLAWTCDWHLKQGVALQDRAQRRLGVVSEVLWEEETSCPLPIN